MVLQWSLTSFPPANAANSVMNTGVLPRWGTCRALWKAPADWHLESSWWQGHFWVACSTSVSGWRGPECAWSHKHNFNLRRAKQTQGSLDKDPPPSYLYQQRPEPDPGWCKISYPTEESFITRICQLAVQLVSLAYSLALLPDTADPTCLLQGHGLTQRLRQEKLEWSFEI